MAEQIMKLKKAPAYRFIPFILVCYAYMCIYVGNNLVQQAAVQLREWFSISDTQLSVLSSATILFFGVFEFVGSFLVPKIGAKKVCMAGMAVLAISGILFFLKPESYGVMVAIRLFQGIGAGFMSCCVMSLAVVWFPRKQRSIASGVMACSYGLANIMLTNASTSMYAAGQGWNQVFFIFLTIMNAIGLLLFRFISVDSEKTYGVINIDEIIEGSEYDDTAEVKTYTNDKFKPYDSWGVMLKSASFWTFMIPIFLYCWNVYALSFVMPLLLTEKGFSPAESATIQSLVFLGAIIGSPLGGIISDKIFGGRRATISGIAFLGSALFLLVFPYVIDSGNRNLFFLSLWPLASYLVMHFAAGPQWVMPSELCTPKFSMCLMGLSLIVTKIGGIIGPVLAGWFSDTTGTIMGGIWSIVIVSIIAGIANFVLAKKWGL